eukprot:TRINITY_DN22555_c0_g1_i1.p1 TRINITY_DN22555_c0_g1~~TRINITY_DN22555_c0_g1_i1.p1  ORF type:complete len:531 (+),score=205.80 TRINITY_DN22555_c0_g1_i1:101-1693(+)
MSLLPSDRADWYASESVAVELHRVMDDLTYCETMLATVPGEGEDQQLWRLRAVDLQERMNSLKQTLLSRRLNRMGKAGEELPEETQIAVMGRWTAAAGDTSEQRDDVAAGVGYKSFLQNKQMGVVSLMLYTDGYVFELLQGPEGIVRSLVGMFEDSELVAEAHVLAVTQDPKLFLEMDEGTPSKVCRIGKELVISFNLLAEKLFVIHPYAPLAVKEQMLEKRENPTKLETSMQLIVHVESYGMGSYADDIHPECTQSIQRLLHEVVHKYGGDAIHPCGMGLSYLFDPLCLRPVLAQCLSIIKDAKRYRAEQKIGPVKAGEEHLPLIRTLHPIISLHCDVFTQFSAATTSGGVFAHEHMQEVCLGEGLYIARNNLRCAGEKTSIVVSQPVADRLGSAYGCFKLDDGFTSCYGIRQADGVDLDAWKESLEVLAPKEETDADWDPCHGAGGGTLSAQGFPSDDDSLRPLFTALDPEKRGFISKSVLKAYLRSQDISPQMTGTDEYALSQATALSEDKVSYDEFCLEVLRFNQR